MTGNFRGILLMVMSMAGFAIEDMCIKLAAADLPTGQILLILGLTGTVLFAALGRLQGAPSLIDRQVWHGAVVARNIGEIVGTAGFVTAIALAQLTTATAVFQALPLAVTLGAALFLGEAVGWRRWTAIIVGFLGVLLIIRPGLDGFEPNALWSVLAVAGLAVRDIATRKVPARVHTLQLAGWGLIAVTLLGAGLLAVTGGAVWPSPTTALLIGIAATVGFFAYWALTAATRMADVGATTPFRYTRLVFAMIIGALVFNETPDLLTWLGAGLIVGSGLYTLARERRLRRLSMASAAR